MSQYRAPRGVRDHAGPGVRGPVCRVTRWCRGCPAEGCLPHSPPPYASRPPATVGPDAAHGVRPLHHGRTPRTHVPATRSPPTIEHTAGPARHPRRGEPCPYGSGCCRILGSSPGIGEQGRCIAGARRPSPVHGEFTTGDEPSSGHLYRGLVPLQSHGDPPTRHGRIGAQHFQTHPATAWRRRCCVRRPGHCVRRAPCSSADRRPAGARAGAGRPSGGPAASASDTPAAAGMLGSATSATIRSFEPTGR